MGVLTLVIMCFLSHLTGEAGVVGVGSLVEGFAAILDATCAHEFFRMASGCGGVAGSPGGVRQLLVVPEGDSLVVGGDCRLKSEVEGQSLLHSWW